MRKTGLIVVLVNVFLSPFLFYLFHFNYLEYPRYVFLIASCMFLSVLIAIGICKNVFCLPRDYLTYSFVVFLCIVFLADIYGVDPKTSLFGSQLRFQGFLTLLSGFVLYLSTRLFFQGKMLQRLPDTAGLFLYLFVVLLCAIGVFQWIDFYYFEILFVNGYDGRVYGSFGNPNFLGGYLAVLAPFVLFLGFVKKMYRSVALMTFVCLVIVVFLTFSKAAWLALCVGIVMYLIVWKWQRSILKNVAGIGFFVILLVVGLVYIAGISGRWSQWDNREVIWGEVLRLLGKRPVLGYGQDNLALVFDPWLFYRVDDAHNIFLNVTVSSGFLGLIAFLIMLFFALRKGSGVVRVGIIVFLITALFNPVSIAQLVLFFFLLGLVPVKMDFR